MQYVPGAPDVPAAHDLIAEFNKKYEGKVLTTNEELTAKVHAFNKLKEDMVPLQSEAQKAASEVAKAQAAKQAEHQAKLAEAAKQKAEAEAAAEAAKMADPEYAKLKAKEKNDMDVLAAIGADQHELQSAKATIAKHKLNITPQEGAAIRAYVGSHYNALNDDLRRGQLLSIKQIKYAKLLQNALTKMPVYEGYVQRGIKNDPGGKIFEHYAKNVGHAVVEHQFNSAGVKEKLWGKTTLHIESKTARDIRSFNSGEGGGEVVFTPGTHWHVIKVNKSTQEVWIEEI
jgi:hypothetical protein